MDATGAGRTRAYELAEEILALLPGLVRPPGRPKAPPAPETAPTNAEAIGGAVIDYLVAHPGCVVGGTRRHYSDGFRALCVELRTRFAHVALDKLATLVRVPRKTLAEWLRDASTTTTAVQDRNEPAADAANRPDAASPRIQTILAAWRSWRGPFTRFCDYVRYEMRIPFGRTFISTILATHGVRRPDRRPGRSPDEKATRSAFISFFPGAQWVGDGMEVPVSVNGERFTFNFELDVDAHVSALVGAAISDQEDTAAVIDAFHDGVDTTGAPPISLLLDNRESNHTAEVDVALGDTLRIRSTPARGQSKAHVEGAFGLFSRTAPALDIRAQTARDIAEQTLNLVVQTWARTLNHKPRNDRGGRSRVDLYREAKPSNDQITAAKRALEARQKQQEKSYETRRAREDPAKRTLIDRAFRRLALADRDGNAQSAIARYPLDAICDGIAIFEAKRAAKTLPDDAGARYLLGIVRNRAHDDEDRHLIDALIRGRLEARDLLVRPLELARQRIAHGCLDSNERLDRFVDCLLDADRQLDRLFWLSAAADLIADQDNHKQLDCFRRAARRLRTAYRVPHRLRQQAIVALAQACPALACT